MSSDDIAALLATYRNAGSNKASRDAAFAKIYASARPIVEKAVRAVLGELEVLVDDAISDTFAVLVANLADDRFAIPAQPYAYFTSKARNAALKRKQAVRAAAEVQQAAELAAEIARGHIPPSEELQSELRIRRGRTSDEDEDEEEVIARAKRAAARRMAALSSGLVRPKSEAEKKVKRATRAKEDERLILAYRAGDDSALETLLRHYKNHMILWARYVVRNAQVAKDIERDVYRKVLSKIDTFKFVHNGKRTWFSSWLYRVVHNAAVDAVKKYDRKLKREALVADIELAQREAADAKRGIFMAVDSDSGLQTYTPAIQEERLIQEEEERGQIKIKLPLYVEPEPSVPRLVQRRTVESTFLLDALSQLPTEQQEVMLLYDIEKMSYKEIAAKLYLPIGTVESRIARARDNIERISSGLPVRRRGRPPKAVAEPKPMYSRKEGRPLVPEILKVEKPKPSRRRIVVRPIVPRSGSKGVVRKPLLRKPVLIPVVSVPAPAPAPAPAQATRKPSKPPIRKAILTPEQKLERETQEKIKIAAAKAAEEQALVNEEMEALLARMERKRQRESAATLVFGKKPTTDVENDD